MNRIIRILGIGQGQLVPSTRYRLKEPFKAFRALGLELDIFEPLIDSYPPQTKFARVVWIFKVLSSRFPILWKQYSYELLILQREMVSTLYTFEHFFKKPFILDIDDAIHLHQKLNAVNKIAHKADAIVVCNDFLANYYQQYNPNIHIIPTPVDVKKYHPAVTSMEKNHFIVGWIGTSSNFPSLKSIEQQLAIFLDQNPNAVLKIVSNENPHFLSIPDNRYIYQPWSEIDDVSNIQSFDIGIMPLLDTEHSRGKCAFKMLQYMACGIPVISSCLPMNKKILDMGNCGICIENKDDWITALERLYHDGSIRYTMGQAGRKIVEKNFSTELYARRYKDIILNIISKGKS